MESRKFNVEPLMWEKQDNSYVKCSICHNRCLISPGSTSRCTSRLNVDGGMELNTFGLISSLAADPIEKKPLYHFHPGTKVFSVGGWGCNFTCLHCQNWQISQPSKKEEEILLRQGMGIGGYCVSPQELVELIGKNDCQGLSWTYNEPSTWLEYTIESGKLAKEKGYYTAYVTNGYITPEALDTIAPYLDAFRVDLKSFSDEFYTHVCGIKNWWGIYETTEHAKNLGLHIEVVTNIIPTQNDSEENLRKIAHWIANNLGEDTPWHVTRFFPYNKLEHLPPTPIEKINRAVEIGKEEGLDFIYKGNVGEKSITKCPRCGTTAIERTAKVQVNTTPSGQCTVCSRDLNIDIT
ncbi:MAG: AmmeMemoRadiSam system radical SAM enzyme [Candidatus Melainabacteria bacterium GWF2_32_7]|nr:MAG: AmmeMemoRadiSam system radical SAM enzyme [Candidatus Melainabacteria bacterium GWF2_32_7]